MPLVIKNIKSLVQTLSPDVTILKGKEMSELKAINDAYLIAENGIITNFGPMHDFSHQVAENDEVIDASGRFVFPSFCDPHTHIVYSGSREKELTDRLKGFSYAEIAERGGGILSSAQRVHQVSEDELYKESMTRIDEITGMGTGAVEIKSGYGLNTADEMKMLRVIRRIKENSFLEVKATFLGAHSVPAEYRNNRDKYIDIIINEMIPLVASDDLADYIDVFCDRGFFTTDESEKILMAGIKYGLIPKLHANELDYSGGVQVGVKYNAISVDHLEHSGDEEIKVLSDSETIPVLLPGSAFFLGLPRPPVRKMIEAGLPVALASDYNPGSSPSGNMKLILSLACLNLGMLAEEAINAATINAASAMGIAGTHGSITKGKVANLFITAEIPSYEYLPYAFGSNLIDKIILKGIVIKPDR